MHGQYFMMVKFLVTADRGNSCLNYKRWI